MWQALVAAGGGLIFTAAARLIDKFLPDPEGKNPLPPPPTMPPPPRKKQP